MINWKKYTSKELKDTVRLHQEKICEELGEKKHCLKLSSLNKHGIIKLIYNHKIPLPPPIPKEDRPTASRNPLVKFKTKQYTEDEQEKYVKNIDLEHDVMTFKELTRTPQKHQIDFVKKFMFNETRGCLLFHGVGTGKTSSALLASQVYLAIKPQNKVIIICPASVVNGFVSEMIQNGFDIRDKRYFFYSFDQYRKKPQLATNSLLIVDEAHNFRTFMGIHKEVSKDDPDKFTWEAYQNFRGYKALVFGAIPADKVILMTGTPFVNILYDIENLMSMIDGKYPLNPKEFDETAIGSKNTLIDYFSFKISHFEKEATSEFFPKRLEKIVGLVMDSEEFDEYTAIEGANNAEMIQQFFGKKIDKADKYVKSFYGGLRQSANRIKMLNNPKIDYIMKLIKKHKDGKFVIYTGFQENGIALLTKRLTDEGERYGLITGRQTKTDREIAKDRYNEYYKGGDDSYRVLIISRAGAEGVDLKHTTFVIMMDEVWNDATAEQIIARGIRFKSHYDLPKDKHFVKVRKLLLIKEDEKPFIDAINNGELLDYKFIADEFKKKLNPKKDEGEYRIKQAEIKQMPEFNRSEYRKLKTTEEKRGYLEKLTFNRYGVKNNVIKLQAQVAEIFMNQQNKNGDLDRQAVKIQIPSIDLYLLIRAKSKSLLINNFITQLDELPQLEDLKTEYEEKFFDALAKLNKNKKTTNAKRLELYREIFGKSINKVITDLTITAEKAKKEGERDLKAMLEALKFKNDKKLDKLQAKINQEYFTDATTANELYEFSSIGQRMDKLTLLEPTAGCGNLLLPILKARKWVDYDLVEINKENRDSLNKIIADEEAGDYMRVHKTPNFLKVVADKQYDYIIMNPPFHLRKLHHPYYKRDIWDFDFVYRAYQMLKKGGELVAIISQHYKTDENMMNFFKKVGATIQEREQAWSGQKYGDASGIKKLKLAFIKIVSDIEPATPDYVDLFVEKDLPLPMEDLIALKYTTPPNVVNKIMGKAEEDEQPKKKKIKSKIVEKDNEEEEEWKRKMREDEEERKRRTEYLKKNPPLRTEEEIERDKKREYLMNSFQLKTEEPPRRRRTLLQPS